MEIRIRARFVIFSVLELFSANESDCKDRKGRGAGKGHEALESRADSVLGDC